MNSEVPHHHGAPDLHGHDGLLPNVDAAPCSSTAEHDEIRSHRYAISRAATEPTTTRLPIPQPQKNRALFRRGFMAIIIADSELTRRQCGNRCYSWSRNEERNRRCHDQFDTIALKKISRHSTQILLWKKRIANIPLRWKSKASDTDVRLGTDLEVSRYEEDCRDMFAYCTIHHAWLGVIYDISNDFAACSVLCAERKQRASRRSLNCITSFLRLPTAFANVHPPLRLLLQYIHTLVDQFHQ